MAFGPLYANLPSKGGIKSGTVNTSGTTVTWVSGDQFDSSMNGQSLTINSVNYTVTTVSSATSLTLTATAGTQTNVAYGYGQAHYVDQTSWDQMIGNFSAWQDNVNANGKNLSAVAQLYATNAFLGASPVAAGVLSARAGANQNLIVSTGVLVAAAVSLNYVNDANNANVPVEIRATQMLVSLPGAVVGIGYSNPGSSWSNEALGVMNTSAGGRTTGLNLINNANTVGTAVSVDFTPNTNIPLARINAYRSGGGGQTDLIFSNYNGTSMVENFRIISGGGISSATLPSANPGAGTKQFWYDPADSNRVKFAA